MATVETLVESGKLCGMAARKHAANNNQLVEAMALLIRNQAAFVEQIARSDRERLELTRKSEELQRKNDERFSRIETILLQLPKAIKKEIGFKSPT